MSLVHVIAQNSLKLLKQQFWARNLYIQTFGWACFHFSWVCIDLERKLLSCGLVMQSLFFYHCQSWGDCFLFLWALCEGGSTGCSPHFLLLGSWDRCKPLFKFRLCVWTCTCGSDTGRSGDTGNGFFPSTTRSPIWNPGCGVSGKCLDQLSLLASTTVV